MRTPDRPLVVSAVVSEGVVGNFGLGVTTEIFGYDRGTFDGTIDAFAARIHDDGVKERASYLTRSRG